MLAYGFQEEWQFRKMLQRSYKKVFDVTSMATRVMFTILQELKGKSKKSDFLLFKLNTYNTSSTKNLTVQPFIEKLIRTRLSALTPSQ